MTTIDIQPFTKLKNGSVRPIVLAVGDPSRADIISKMADSSTLLAENKAYKSYDCSINGVHFTTISHGVGNTGAAICFQELINAGAKCIIRAGTSGFLQDGMKQGDIFISYGAVREEGVTPKFVGEEFPAIPTPQVFQELLNATKKLDYTYHIGLNITSEVFYTTPDILAQMRKYADSGVSSVSMEESTLYIIGSKYNIWTGVIQVFDGSPFQWINLNYDPHGNVLKIAKQNMIKVCFDAIVQLSSKYFQ